jgi:hypothetical protein
LRIVEPEYEALVTRFGELQQEAAAAQQAEDAEAFQNVMNEAQTIQMRLRTPRSRPSSATTSRRSWRATARS